MRLISNQHPAYAAQTGYWADCIVFAPASGRTSWLGWSPAADAGSALDWIRGRVVDLSQQLDPEEADRVKDWLASVPAQEVASVELEFCGIHSIQFTDSAGAVFVFSARTAAARGLATKSPLPHRVLLATA